MSDAAGTAAPHDAAGTAALRLCEKLFGRMRRDAVSTWTAYSLALAFWPRGAGALLGAAVVGWMAVATTSAKS